MSMIVDIEMVAKDEVEKILTWEPQAPPPPKPKPTGILCKFLSMLCGGPKAATPETPPFESGPGISLDKAWHAIHFLLTGAAAEGDWPEGFIVSGGAEIPGTDMGYGNARILTPAQVGEVNEVLRELDAEALHERYNPDKMDELSIYQAPTPGDETAARSDWTYFVSNYSRLRKFIAAAAEKDMGVVISLS